jgi:hypothetical protein
MAIKTVVRAAVTVSVAGAMQHMQTTEAKWGLSTDLPRAELQTKDLKASGCGKDFPGFFTLDGLSWPATWRTSKVWNATECMQTCEDTQHCVGFSTLRGHGKVQCSLYKGLQKQADHMGMSYTKCVKVFSGCSEGFQLSHAGTWRNGKKMVRLDDEDMLECQKACKNDKGCVGFTHRVNKVNDTFCLHFTDEGNEQGAKRDAKANTYSRCVLQGQLLDAGDLVDDNQTEDDSGVQAPASADDQNEGQFVAKDEKSEAPDSADGQSQASGNAPAASEDDDAL